MFSPHAHLGKGSLLLEPFSKGLSSERCKESHRFSSFKQISRFNPASIVIYGGTFDPPHIDHLKIALRLKSKADLLVIIPTAHNPLKSQRPRVSDEDRIAMLEELISNQEGMVILTNEIDRSKYGKSSSETIDTLHEARTALPNAEIVFALGVDCLPRLNEWSHWRELFSIAKFLPIARKGGDHCDWNQVKDKLGSEIETQLKKSLMNAPEVGACSSTEIRKLLEQGVMAGPGLLHPGVERYIREKKLYR